MKSPKAKKNNLVIQKEIVPKNQVRSYLKKKESLQVIQKIVSGMNRVKKSHKAKKNNPVIQKEIVLKKKTRSHLKKKESLQVI